MRGGVRFHVCLPLASTLLQQRGDHLGRFLQAGQIDPVADLSPDQVERFRSCAYQALAAIEFIKGDPASPSTSEIVLRNLGTAIKHYPKFCDFYSWVASVRHKRSHRSPLRQILLRLARLAMKEIDGKRVRVNKKTGEPI